MIYSLFGSLIIAIYFHILLLKHLIHVVAKLLINEIVHALHHWTISMVIDSLFYIQLLKEYVLKFSCHIFFQVDDFTGGRLLL
jgi:hypothetical protein